MVANVFKEVISGMAWPFVVIVSNMLSILCMKAVFAAFI